ncbi:hypothetical protein SAMN05216383_12047 [Prevotella sp. KH2C16]|nr:hypothetical protein SAMN05216383_12047 [Prevotella sp. KH2C16]
MTIDIRNDIPHEIAITCLLEVIKMGRISNNNTLYCYDTRFHTSCGTVVVATREYRKSDCFVIYKEEKYNEQSKQTNRDLQCEKTV